VIARLRAWARELKAQLVTLWFCRSHPATPLAAKLLAGFVVAYAFSPIDLIPDFIPVIGYLDDLVIVPAGIYLALRLIPAHVVAASREKAAQWLARNDAKPKSYAAATFIVLLWLLLALWAWQLLA
jgi:uncharacterized membrane protein YkvA (DUF1232 family)